MVTRALWPSANHGAATAPPRASCSSEGVRWADTGYRTEVIDHGAHLGIDVEVVQRDPGQKGFKILPRPWVVERTFGWLMQHHRRLARDYATHPHRSETMIKLAMVALISRRLTRETTPNWRDT
ncbi:transposase [Streptomyces sp. C10-9-1]|nr:transposase [Streptomyces sp. C10-9-1]